MKDFFRKAAVAAAAVGTSALAFAEGESADAIDVSAATGALDTMKTAVTTYFDSAMPILVYVLGLGLVIVLAMVGWKLFKRVTNKAG